MSMQSVMSGGLVDMKKRVISVIIFFAGLLALLLLLSGFLLPKKNRETYGMEEERANGIRGEKPDTIDVLVIGNSLAYTDLIPPQIFKDKGYTSYTCGTNSQPLDYSYELLQRALKHQSPRIVLLETGSFYEEITAFDALLSDVSHILPCFRYHDRWKKLLRDDFIPPFRTELSYQSKFMGYYFLEGSDPGSQEEIDNHMKNTDSIRKVPEWSRIYINRIADLCRENGIKLALITMPNISSWDMEMHNGSDEIARETGCEYLDLNLLNDQIGIDWHTDTCDKGEHLNYEGAMKVTRFFSDYLEQTQLLEDHRSDPAYSDWDKHLQKYEKHLRKREKKQNKETE